MDADCGLDTEQTSRHATQCSLPAHHGTAETCKRYAQCLMEEIGRFTDIAQLYKPWELRDEEEDRIDDQISETKAQIERELADHEQMSTIKADSVNNGTQIRATQAI